MTCGDRDQTNEGARAVDSEDVGFGFGVGANDMHLPLLSLDQLGQTEAQYMVCTIVIMIAG